MPEGPEMSPPHAIFVVEVVSEVVVVVYVIGLVII